MKDQPASGIHSTATPDAVLVGLRRAGSRGPGSACKRPASLGAQVSRRRRRGAHVARRAMRLPHRGDGSPALKPGSHSRAHFTCAPYSGLRAAARNVRVSAGGREFDRGHAGSCAQRAARRSPPPARAEPALHFACARLQDRRIVHRVVAAGRPCGALRVACAAAASAGPRVRVALHLSQPRLLKYHIGTSAYATISAERDTDSPSASPAPA